MARFTYETRETVFGTKVEIGDLGGPGTDMLSAQTFIPLDICALRDISSNAIQNLVAHGGILASDSTPVLERINAATDRQLRVRWAASDSNEAQFPPIPIPPDLDSDENVIVHLLLQRSGSTDDCDIDVLAYFNGIGAYTGDTEMGGKTAALTTTNVEEVTVTLASANISGHPGFLSLTLLPDAHTTDALYLLAAWIEYTRKLRTT